MSWHNTSRPVAVTGYGAVSSLGQDVATIWNSLIEKRIGYKTIEYPEKRIRARFFGLIDSEIETTKDFSKALTKGLPPHAKYALAATREAIDMAFRDGGGPGTVYSPFDAGVIIGTGWGGLDSANHNNNDYHSTGFSSSFATIASMNNTATSAVSMYCQFRGYQSTPVAACASGALAIGEAYDVIRSGRAKIMVAGGSESLREVLNVYSIDRIGALCRETNDPTRASCPFDRRRTGFVLAEGAAVLVLEDYDAAVERGAIILGEITGYGNYTDAHDQTIPAPDLQARVRAIEGALLEAGLAPSNVDYVNAHGTSTPLNDLNESEAIKLALGREAAYTVPVSSTKSYTGHLIGAAGAIEAIFCLKAIQDRIIPATINLLEPDPQCDLDYVPNEHRHATLRHCLTLSFGFGGANVALVIEKAR